MGARAWSYGRGVVLGVPTGRQGGSSPPTARTMSEIEIEKDTVQSLKLRAAVLLAKQVHKVGFSECARLLGSYRQRVWSVHAGTTPMSDEMADRILAVWGGAR